MHEEKPLQREEVRQWYLHPITQRFCKLLEERKEFYSELVLCGAILETDKPEVELAGIVKAARLVDEILTKELFEDEYEETENS